MKRQWLLILTGLYCGISVMMNYLCMKPLSFGTSFVWMDGGLLISWIVFLISNVLTEVYGKRTAMTVTGVATIATLSMSLIALGEVYIPTLDVYAEQANHFAYVFSNGPRTIIASAIAFFVSGVVNVNIIAGMKRCASERHPALAFVTRAILSTIVGQLVDNTLFQTLAFAPIGLSLYEMRWYDIATAIVCSTGFETIVESCFIPLVTLPLSNYLNKLE